MKKALLFSACLVFFMGIKVFGYETVIVKYPNGEIWTPVYYNKNFAEGIIQYVRKGETNKEWVKTVVIHSYNGFYGTAKSLMDKVVQLNRLQNPTSHYKILKEGIDDVIMGRCTREYKNLSPQCEILRATKGHNGIVTVHYINKDLNEFRYTYDEWYERIKKTSFYESYFRNDRVLNKSMYLEL